MKDVYVTARLLTVQPDYKPVGPGRGHAESESGSISRPMAYARLESGPISRPMAYAWLESGPACVLNAGWVIH